MNESMYVYNIWCWPLCDYVQHCLSAGIDVIYGLVDNTQFKKIGNGICHLVTPVPIFIQ